MLLARAEQATIYSPPPPPLERILLRSRRLVVMGGLQGTDAMVALDKSPTVPSSLLIHS